MPNRTEVYISIYKPHAWGESAAWLIEARNEDNGEEVNSAATSLAAAKRHAVAIAQHFGSDRSRLTWKDKNGILTAVVYVSSEY